LHQYEAVALPQVFNHISSSAVAQPVQQTDESLKFVVCGDEEEIIK
jgi:hypothetical protein